MNIYGKLLVFCVLQYGVSGFQVRAPKASSKVGLAMADASRAATGLPQSQTYQNLNKSYGTGGESVQALEARLDALEKGKTAPSNAGGAYANGGKMIWDDSKTLLVQGGSLKTWSYGSSLVNRVQVLLRTEGRPLDSEIELWQGPDNSPVKMRVYVEDGSKRPFITSIETPSAPNTISVRNTGHLEFPFSACVLANAVDKGPVGIPHKSTMTVQGGAIKAYGFEPVVKSVQICLKTDGRPLNCKIELLQGPNNLKQLIQLYTEDALLRPFYMVVETPGTGNVVRICNISPVEFPLTAMVEPYLVDNNDSNALDPVIGGTP
jgi:hypothetical protein